MVVGFADFKILFYICDFIAVLRTARSKSSLATAPGFDYRLHQDLVYYLAGIVQCLGDRLEFAE